MKSSSCTALLCMGTLTFCPTATQAQEAADSASSVVFEHVSEAVAFNVPADSKTVLMNPAKASSHGAEATNCIAGSVLQNSKSSAEASGQVLSTSESSTTFRLKASAEATGGEFMLCKQLGGRTVTKKFVQSDAIGLARAIARVPINFTPDHDGESLEVAIHDNIDDDAYVMDYRIVSEQNRVITIDPRIGVAVTVTPSQRLYLEAELIVAAARSGLGSISKEAIADITVSLRPASRETPRLDTLPREALPRVAGGKIESGFPQVVAILYKNKQVCTGTIIGMRTVLSAAHCVSGRYLSYFHIVVGPQAYGGAQTEKIVCDRDSDPAR